MSGKEKMNAQRLGLQRSRLVKKEVRLFLLNCILNR